MSQVCPCCSQTDGEYADIDQIRTFIGGYIHINFWLCKKCTQANIVHLSYLQKLYTLKSGVLDELTEYFRNRGYFLRNLLLRKTRVVALPSSYEFFNESEKSMSCTHYPNEPDRYVDIKVKGRFGETIYIALKLCDYCLTATPLNEKARTAYWALPESIKSLLKETLRTKYPHTLL